MESAERGQCQSNVTELEASSSSPLVPIVSLPTPYERRNTFRIGPWEFSLPWTNALFVLVVLGSSFGQTILLPLWIDSIKDEISSAAFVDRYFMLSFASLSFVVIFGLAILLIRIFSPKDLGETERNFPHLLLFLVGLCGALNGVLAIFASNREKTPRSLEAILGTCKIPLIILFRRFILRKTPNIRKLLCAVVVTLSPVVYLIPNVHGVVNLLWPVIMTIRFVPAALASVLSEKGVKMRNEMSRRGINLVYFMFWISTYQLLCVALMFWVNILPGSGNASIVDLETNWRHGLQCFFGAGGCSSRIGTRGTLYIFMSVLLCVGKVHLLRHSEGSAWVAVVESPVTPLAFIFWSFFNEDPFKWHSDGDVNDSGFAIGALVVMFSAIMIYEVGDPEISLDDESRRREEI
ncbi:uncharacterized protein LOC110052684 [Orbicella faveolata]|uniref:uncharacterized protein LOC110052684 n=1 Tax=Orbicella faveolata TaxID=48498 RepID=UPI0009E1DD5B|nr:uncharacterized protein LOC110052684 [Orbicella faveolata]